MPIILAYCVVVLIWSTTPMAIQVSQSEMSFYAALAIRIWISAFLSVPVLMFARQSLVFTAEAMRTYFAGAIGVYAAMLCVYWGASYLPSGLISVFYGLSPMISGVLANFWLKEKELTPARILALLVALSGLYLVVAGQLTLGEDAWKGITGTLVSVFLFSLSGVAVKRTASTLHPMVQTSGILWVASVGFCLTLPFFNFSVATELSRITWVSMGYLAIGGSLLGFVLYYYILKHLPAARVALVTLVAPVLAIFWGHLLRGEQLSVISLSGSLMMLMALSMYQWNSRLDKLLKTMAIVQGRGAVKIKKS